MSDQPGRSAEWLNQNHERLIRAAFMHRSQRLGLLEHEARRASPPPRPWRIYAGIASCIIVPLIPLGIGLMISHALRTRAAKRRRAELLDPACIANGRVTVAVPLMFNSMFMRGRVPEAPGLVLIVDDDGPELSEDEMLELITRISLADMRSKDPVERGFAALMANERFVAQKRVRIDPSVTNGRVIYAAHLMVSRSELVADLDEFPMIPCFVGRGERAIIRVVPAEVFATVADLSKELARAIGTKEP
ncbi:MAG: hypothetical protein KF902_14385 [Phycisphaeraceae bacterium]|nr:hypothetical protein [Phycisphaeraceae bacterium]